MKIKHLETYEEKCIGCNNCMVVCANLYFKENDEEKSCIRISEKDGGFSINVCNQCGICVAECPTEALTVNSQGVVMLNKNLCIGCYACVAICPTNSMRRYPGMVVPFKCIACGACPKECPTEAIEIVSKEK